MPFRRAFFACLLSLVFLSSARAESVTVSVDTSNPPFMYALEDERAAGVYPAIIVEAFARSGISATVKAVPWRRALAELDAGNGAIGGFYKNTERLARYDYSDELYVERIQAVVLKGQAAPFAGLESLRGRRVGVLQGWSYGDAFDQARAAGLFTVEEVNGDGQNLAKLKAGRIDVALANPEGAQAAMAALHAPDDFAILEPPLLTIATHLAFAKHARKGELIAAFNRGLASMKADGTLERIARSLLPAP